MELVEGTPITTFCSDARLGTQDRLNLFRKVEIHCVGMGEANMSTLRTIAALGKGEAISLRSGSK